MASPSYQHHRLSQRWIQKQFRELGDTVTIVEVARAFSNDAYRDETETFTTHTAYCHIHILTEQDTSVNEGEARAGDLVFSFDYSYMPYLKQMNRIIYDDRTFQISDVRRFRAIGNTLYMIDCATKKYSDGTAWLKEVTDEITIEDGAGASNLKKTLKDDITFNSIFNRQLTSLKVLTESIKINDDFSKQWNSLKFLVENLRVSDGSKETWNAILTLIEDLEISDDEKGMKVKVLIDTLNVKDYPSKTWDAVKTLIDDIITSDFKSKTWDAYLKLSDDLNASDNSTKDISKEIPDGLLIENLETAKKDINKALSEEVIPSDDVAPIKL
jgi:hypothetical protein